MMLINSYIQDGENRSKLIIRETTKLFHVLSITLFKQILQAFLYFLRFGYYNLILL